MDRRLFLGTTAAGVALSTFPCHSATTRKIRRVGLIGSGWYGKADLLRLIQVAPDEIDVVSLCDVDRNMVAQAAEIVASRQKSGAKPRPNRSRRRRA